MGARDVMVFRQYENLVGGEVGSGELVDVFVGMMGGGVYSGDMRGEWVINNNRRCDMECGMEEDEYMGIDVTEELVELMRVYVESERVLRASEECKLRYMTAYMKEYIGAKEKREEVTIKIEKLKNKMNGEEECEDGDEDE